MKTNIVCAFVALTILILANLSFAYYDGRLYYPNPAPYPIGCTTFVVTEPGNFHAHAKAEVLLSETMPFWDMGQVAQLDVEVRAIRIGCTEPGRSIILVQLTVPQIDDGIRSWVPIPLVFGEIDDLFYPLRLARESNTHWKINEFLAEGDTAGYYLDNWEGWEWSLEFSSNLQRGYAFEMQPSQYNSEFTLHFVDLTTWEGSVEGPFVIIPAYDNQLQESRLLWHGMLSGIWVTPEVPDQGFLISISDTSQEISDPLEIFFTWNTFDQEGEPLWLAGNGSLKPHTEAITVDLMVVKHGQFLGPGNAERMRVGSLQLQAKSCTEILADFDLGLLGLGSGSFVLTRLQNLETSGYNCQDSERLLNVD